MPIQTRLVNYWLFQVVDLPVGKLKHIAEQIFAKRAQAGFWGLKSNSPHITSLAYGDRIVFYIGGEFKHHIAGIGTIISELHDITDYERANLYTEEVYQKAVSIRFDRTFKPFIDESLIALNVPRHRKGRLSIRTTIFPLQESDFKKIESLIQL